MCRIDAIEPLVQYCVVLSFQGSDLPWPGCTDPSRDWSICNDIVMFSGGRFCPGCVPAGSPKHYEGYALDS